MASGGFGTVSAGLHNQTIFGSISTPVTGREDRLNLKPPGFDGGITQGSLAVLLQQMDDSNHDMVNMFTQQMGTVMTPLMQNTNDVCTVLAQQMVLLNQALGVYTPPNNQPEAHPQPVVAANQARGQKPNLNRGPQVQKNQIPQIQVEQPREEEQPVHILQRNGDHKIVPNQALRYL